jgi:hypothetical protein
VSEQREYGEEERVPEHSGTSHVMAIGFYIGTLIVLIGVMLALYGLLGPAQQAYKSLGININLWWGLFMVFFGCVVLGMSYTSPRRRAAREAARRNSQNP